jgi:hypothetical protein
LHGHLTHTNIKIPTKNLFGEPPGPPPKTVRALQSMLQGIYYFYFFLKSISIWGCECAIWQII